MKIRRALALVFLLALPRVAPGAPARAPYSSGEKAAYAITWFGATAGTLELEVLPPGTENGKPTTELQVKARTDFFFSLFYSLKNTYRSTADSATGLPIRFVISFDETKLGGTVTQEFDHANKKLLHKDRRVDRKEGSNLVKDLTQAIRPGTQDVVSVFFHIRTLPLAKGATFDLPVYIGEEALQLRVEVTGEEDLPTKIGDVPSWKLKPSLLKDGKPKEIPETLVWIAKAPPFAMVKLKAKVKIGSVVAYLKSFEPGGK